LIVDVDIIVVKEPKVLIWYCFRYQSNLNLLLFICKTFAKTNTQSCVDIVLGVRCFLLVLRGSYIGAKMKAKRSSLILLELG